MSYNGENRYTTSSYSTSSSYQGQNIQNCPPITSLNRHQELYRPIPSVEEGRKITRTTETGFNYRGNPVTTSPMPTTTTTTYIRG